MVDYYKGATASAVIASADTDVAALAASDDLRLVGYSVKESAGSPAAATAILRHGDDIADPPLAFINLAASQEKTHFFGEQGIKCPDGVFLERVTGSMTLILYYRNSAVG